MVNYSVLSFTNNIITFKFLDTFDESSKNIVNLNLIEFAKKYRGVSNSHYFDTKNDTIVILGYPTHSRLFVLDDGILYRRAIQSEYDEYEYKLFPNSDNSKIYEFLKNIYDERLIN